MDDPTRSPLTGLPAAPKRSVYNPHRLSDADLERSFIARRQTFDDLLHDVLDEAADSHPQHHLVCGQRGMGKTTLLRRVAIELRREPLRRRFVPLTFPEDQHVEVDRLSKFWLNCLDALADALEQEGNQAAEVEQIDSVVHALDRPGVDEETLQPQAREAFSAAILRVKRRPVLLVDNFNLLLARLRGDDYKLRGFFGAAGAPVIVAASVTVPAELQEYGAAFYDGFKTRVLRPLSVDEMRSVITQLARDAGRQAVLARLPAETPRLAALRDLTGGNPRTAVLLFEMFSQGFSENAYEDLENLLDIVTPLYQSRLDQLSDQSQVIVGALARHWAPATSATLSSLTRIPTSSISPQLQRLEEQGLVEKTAVVPEKRSGYQLAERFLNIWYLMRFSTRRQRAGLACLTRFLQDFHTPAQLEGHARRLLTRGSLDRERIPYAMALAGALPKRTALAHRLETKAQVDLVRQAQGIRERIAEVLDPDEIPPRILEFAELQRTLRQAVPSGCSVTGEEFADLVLGSPALLAGADGATRHSIAAGRLDAGKVEEIIRQLRTERSELEGEHGAEAAEWLAGKLREGLITSWDDAHEVSLAIEDSDSPPPVRLVLSFSGSKAKAGLSRRAFGKVRRAVGPGRKADSSVWFGWGLRLHKEFIRYEEADTAYRKSIETDPGYAGSWNNLGVLVQDRLGRYDEAEAAYRKAADLDPELVHPWHNLGNLLQHHLGRYDEAEAAYRKASELDPEHAITWHYLGNLLQNHLARDDEAEVAYRKAIEIDPAAAAPWNNLGNLLHLHLARYDEAEAAYRKAIGIDPKYAAPWNGLGSLLVDHFGRWDEARKAFERSLELDPESDFPRHNLAFALRDYLVRPAEARRVLEGLTNQETLRDTQALHDALSATYDDNWGLAADALRRALRGVDFQLPPNTRDDWFRASAVLLHLGYGEKLVALLEAEGADVSMLPWYAAVSAHAKGDRRYLANAPAEARPAAERIFDEIQERRQRLPERTARMAGR